ncbi:hypothetical protein PPERSA_07384 [Pseudocohnilembus persalinus]|uniref:DUF4200 domain-containing protein n=1 Tax=Pseudocohnilembus persalinus TaxID=266149 RepID=A0A0V0QAB0_PSEPJ|nr:hypothetical protein PPERSA_07384 [Pseudocohnilembus persalinus]|eukprot:KRW99141.1 hypothetical protein PPERSA_07384 [Pseudocohnilembus persalinus]
MTEKILLQENPFIFEQDKKLQETQEDDQTRERLIKQPKKCGIIRALGEEAEKIAKAREEVLLKDQQLGKGKGSMSTKAMRLWDVSDYEPKKGIYKVKKLLKERKETVGDFIQKNRQTFLTNLNITNKEEETNKLEDFIKNEQENLKAMYQYFVKDNQLVQKFMSDVKAAAEKAAKEAEIEAKKKEELKTQINKHLVQKDQCENKNERLRDEIEQLQSYQKFIELTRKNMDAMISEKKKKQQAKKKQLKQNY